jgi:hypothetical protein
MGISWTMTSSIGGIVDGELIADRAGVDAGEAPTTCSGGSRDVLPRRQRRPLKFVLSVKLVVSTTSVSPYSGRANPRQILDVRSGMRTAVERVMRTSCIIS